MNISKYLKTKHEVINDASVEVLIHRLRLRTTLDISYLMSLRKKGKIKDLIIFNNKTRNVPYRIVAKWKIGKDYLLSYFNPVNTWIPRKSCITDITYPSPRLLKKLHELLGEQTVSSAEYTIDFHYDDPSLVQKALYIFRRSLYVRHGKQTMIVGKNHKINLLKKRSENSVYRVGKYMKIYERGDDAKRKSNDKRVWWDYKDLDRLRFEFTARNYHLKKVGVNKLSLFMKNPKFVDTLCSRLLFMEFKGSSKLPRELDDYSRCDKDGNNDCFMEEYLQSSMKNPYQYMVDDIEYDNLKQIIINKILKSEQSWINKIG